MYIEELSNIIHVFPFSQPVRPGCSAVTVPRDVSVVTVPSVTLWTESVSVPPAGEERAATRVSFLSFYFYNCMFYQLLCVQHRCSSTQSLDSELPSVVEMRDQNSRGCPLSLFE